MIGVLCCLWALQSQAFSPPPLGIGAVVFPVRGLTIETISEQPSLRTAVDEASDFFVDAFWTGKVGGGAKKLTESQRRSLEQSQFAEFNRRYGGKRRNAELLLARNSQGEIVACAGVEVDRIPDGSMKSSRVLTQAPVMSNVAVGRKFRRRGLAEQIVKEVESFVQSEWGYESCYLYVEERNRAAVKLYQKLGYRRIWRDNDATTMLPTDSGRLMNSGTVLVCMEKSFGGGFWERLLGRST